MERLRSFLRSATDALSEREFRMLWIGQTGSAIGDSLVGGVWSDRLPRQRVMVACDLLRAAAQAIVATLLITGNAEVWHLIALAIVMGSASAFFTPASVGLMPEIVSAGRVQQANALVSLS